MNYILGIILSLLSEAVISIANVLDGKLSRVTFTSLWSLIVINGLLIVPILPIIYFFFKPKTLSPEQFFIIAIVAAIEVLYQFPYYRALRETDTSIVMSLFNIEKIFIPVLAYFFIGERLKLSQYLGFGLVIFGSLLTTPPTRGFKINKALYYMVFVCTILAIDSVLQKYSLNEVDWRSFYFWMLTFSTPFYILILLLSKGSRKEVLSFIKAPFQRKFIPLFGQNCATWIAGGIGTAALSLLPVTINEAIDSFQLLIVYFIASKGHRQLRLDKQELFSLKRLIVFVLIGVGGLLVVIRP